MIGAIYKHLFDEQSSQSRLQARYAVANKLFGKCRFVSGINF